MFKILIAECEFLEREAIKKIAYKIDNEILILEAAAGNKTIELNSAFKPNLIFLSTQLGGASTRDILKEIRDSRVHPTIILINNYNKKVKLDDLQNLEIHDFLVKPIPSQKIEEIITTQFYDSDDNSAKIKNSSKSVISVYPQTLISKEIKDTLNYIEENYNSEISLDYLANRVYLSTYYLSRLFKKEVGVTLSSYILHKKIEVGKTLLSETDKSIIEISTYLNFKEQTYFCKVFKKKVGVSPTDYRKKNSATSLI